MFLTFLAPFSLACLAATGRAETSPSELVEAPQTPAKNADAQYFQFDRGPGELPVLVPRGEELVYDVVIDAGILGDVDVGDVTLSSDVERTLAALPERGKAPKFFEHAWIMGVADGGYAGYDTRMELKTNLLPQEFPHTFYTENQTGSENRRRELKLGMLEGKLQSWYRNDGHCKGCTNKEHFVSGMFVWNDDHHCKKCKLAEHRVWHDPKQREIPVGAVDMLSAVYLARSLIRDGRDSSTFPLADKQMVWQVKIQRGDEKRVSVPEGKFLCRQVKLSTSKMAGTKDEESGDKFQGLFGIQGQIKIWMDSATGVPVLIEGELPVPLPFIDHLDVSVQLKKHKGTPASFAPQR